MKPLCRQIFAFFSETVTINFNEKNKQGNTHLHNEQAHKKVTQELFLVFYFIRAGKNEKHRRYVFGYADSAICFCKW